MWDTKLLEEFQIKAQVIYL